MTKQIAVPKQEGIYWLISPFTWVLLALFTQASMYQYRSESIQWWIFQRDKGSERSESGKGKGERKGGGA